MIEAVTGVSITELAVETNAWLVHHQHQIRKVSDWSRALSGIYRRRLSAAERSNRTSDRSLHTRKQTPSCGSPHQKLDIPNRVGTTRLFGVSLLFSPLFSAFVIRCFFFLSRAPLIYNPYVTPHITYAHACMIKPPTPFFSFIMLVSTYCIFIHTYKYK